MSIAAHSWLASEAPPRAGALRNEGDARHYVRRTFGLTIGLYVVLAAALWGGLPWWSLLLAVPWLYVRLALALHELLHARAPDELPAFHRLAMIFDTPVGLGFREHREIHLEHHGYSGGPGDPERAQIEGGHARALLMALSTPERALVQWVRAHDLDAPLARQAALRLTVFCALVAVNPAVFAVYWLVLRASITAAGYVFHHVLHNRRGKLGTYALPVSAGVSRAARALFGEEPILILERHRSHHVWPEVRVRDLPELPAAFDLPEGPVAMSTLAAAFRAAGLSATPRARGSPDAGAGQGRAPHSQAA
jgi:fatty acid desaturase